MAKKNHALDSRIERSALNEFLKHGFSKASLRKIAADAGVTVGAIYTRYPTKDALFCSLVDPLVVQIQTTFAAIKADYSGTLFPDPSEIARKMQRENEAILHLLFDNYNLAVLLMCRSSGSTLENFFDMIVEYKIRETIRFFRDKCAPDPHVLKVILSAQFHMYLQILSEGYDLEEAKKMMDSIILYHTGGWLTLLGIPAEAGGSK